MLVQICLAKASSFGFTKPSADSYCNACSVLSLFNEAHSNKHLNISEDDNMIMVTTVLFWKDSRAPVCVLSEWFFSSFGPGMGRLRRKHGNMVVRRLEWRSGKVTVQQAGTLGSSVPSEPKWEDAVGKIAEENLNQRLPKWMDSLATLTLISVPLTKCFWKMLPGTHFFSRINTRECSFSATKDFELCCRLARSYKNHAWVS